jgi:hypothetical protein
MQLIKETEKGLLLEKNSVQFWVQKRWLSGYGKQPFNSCELTLSGTRAYAKAVRKNKPVDLNIFEKVKETDKAILFKCIIMLPHIGEEKADEFWLPKTKIDDNDFIKMKLREVLEKYPFVGVKIKGL